jgi:hypothetical protein
MDVKEFLMKLLRRRGRELLFNAEAVRGTNSIFSEVVGNALIGRLVFVGGALRNTA